MKLVWTILLSLSMFAAAPARASAEGERVQIQVRERVAAIFLEVGRALSRVHSKQQLVARIVEHSLFSRDYAPLLLEAAAVTREYGEISRELTRNYSEEMGAGQAMAHFEMYRLGLKDVGIATDRTLTSSAMNRLVAEFRKILASGSPSETVGAFYAAEMVAVPELLSMRKILDRYMRQSGQEATPRSLAKYFEIHLGGAEQSHQDELGRFVRDYEDFGLEPAGISRGAEMALRALRNWWVSLFPCEMNLRPSL